MTENITTQETIDLLQQIINRCRIAQFVLPFETETKECLPTIFEDNYQDFTRILEAWCVKE
jgi:hypothetical protein